MSPHPLYGLIVTEVRPATEDELDEEGFPEGESVLAVDLRLGSKRARLYCDGEVKVNFGDEGGLLTPEGYQKVWP